MARASCAGRASLDAGAQRRPALVPAALGEARRGRARDHGRPACAARDPTTASFARRRRSHVTGEGARAARRRGRTPARGGAGSRRPVADRRGAPSSGRASVARRRRVDEPVPHGRIGEVYAAADALVNNMRAGALDKVVFEAAAAGLPVLVASEGFDSARAAGSSRRSDSSRTIRRRSRPASWGSPRPGASGAARSAPSFARASCATTRSSGGRSGSSRPRGDHGAARAEGLGHLGLRGLPALALAAAPGSRLGRADARAARGRAGCAASSSSGCAQQASRRTRGACGSTSIRRFRCASSLATVPTILHTHLVHADVLALPAAALRRVPVRISTKHGFNAFRGNRLVATRRSCGGAASRTGRSRSRTASRRTSKTTQGYPAGTFTVVHYGIEAGPEPPPPDGVDAAARGRPHDRDQGIRRAPARVRGRAPPGAGADPRAGRCGALLERASLRRRARRRDVSRPRVGRRAVLRAELESSSSRRAEKASGSLHSRRPSAVARRSCPTSAGCRRSSPTARPVSSFRPATNRRWPSRSSTLVGDPERVRAMGAAARRRAVADFSADAAAAGVEAVYRRSSEEGQAAMRLRPARPSSRATSSARSTTPSGLRSSDYFERRPAGFVVTPFMRPPDESEAGDAERWLERAQIAASLAPLGHHTHWGGASRARDPRRCRRGREGPIGVGVAPRARPRAAVLLRRRLVLGRAGRRDARSLRLRRLHCDDLPPVVPRCERARGCSSRRPRASCCPRGQRSLSCRPRTRSERSRGRRGSLRDVHVHFHDWELLDRKRAAGLWFSLRLLARRRRPLTIDRARGAGGRGT